MPVSDIERRRIKGAVTTLRSYNLAPFIRDFIRAQPAPRIPLGRFDKDGLCDAIQQILLGEFKGRRRYRLTLEDLVDYLDRLQETGRQNLYGFRLAESDRDQTLADLRDVARLRSRVDAPDEIYNGGLIVWEAPDEPELARIRYERDDDGGRPSALIVKWVETRRFWAKPPSDEKASGDDDVDSEDEELEAEDLEEEDLEEEEAIGAEKVSKKVLCEERSVSFLRVDLASGECELRLQALHGRSLDARRKQLTKYRELVAKRLGITLVGPTVLAPAIRRALVGRSIPVVHCSAILPEGGRFIGKKGERPPVDVRRLQAGVTIRFEWRPENGGVARIELDGRLDDILISNPMVPTEHRRLLERIWRWREEGLRIFITPGTPVVEEEGPRAAVIDSPPEPSGKDWVAILKAALRKERPSPLAVEPGIDDAILEYERNHKLEERAVEARVLEQFLRYIREVAETEKTQYETELEIVRRQETWSSRLTIVAAAIALAFVTTAGVMLLFVKGNLPTDTITGLLGLITGRGTVLIRNYQKGLRAKRERVQSQQRDSMQTLIAIQAALAIPDARERSEAMSRCVTKFLDRVTRAAA